ncbi:MAG TPA: hypothetical protein VEI07_06615 [Planctomycetaceae bacterium]|nr:hypothetical protein [Planctomycetaceae bacterium]
MQYILEIVAEKTEKTWESVDTIESDTPIPIPSVGDEVMTPHGWAAKVISRHFWFTYFNRVPLAKIEVRCRRVQPTAPAAPSEQPRRK